MWENSWRTLGITGAGRGVGVTHLAVWTANYLAGKGYDVYGIDASRQGIAIANRTGGGIPAVSSSAT